MTVTEAAVIDVLRPVEDPELHRSIVDLDMVKQVRIETPTVGVLIALTGPAARCAARSSGRSPTRSPRST